MRLSVLSAVFLFFNSNAVNAAALEYHCTFNIRASVDGVEAEDFSVVFFIDTITGEAFLKVNNGISPIFSNSSRYVIFFIEILETEAANVATIT